MVNVKYVELTLNAGDTTLLANVPNFTALDCAKAVDNTLVVNNGSTAGVAVHSREVNSALLASEQFIVINAGSYPAYTTYSSEAQKQKAMASYGFKPDVLLTPYSEVDVQVVAPAYVSGVTYGGAALVDGGTYSDPGELVISGVDLSTSAVQVYNGTERYTPVTQSSTQQTFSIGYPGNYRIIINGNLAYSFTSTIVVVQQVTKVTIGTNESTTIPYTNLTLRGGQAYSVVVEGSELGNLTSDSGEIANAGGDATRRTCTFTPSDMLGDWTLSCGGNVIAHGSVSA